MEFLKAMQEMMETQISSLASWIDIYQVKIDASLAERLVRMKAKMDAHQERMEVKMDDWLEEMRAWGKELTACKEVTEACPKSKEPTSMETEAVAVHEKVPKEEH
jgi:hypothetical protein